MKKTYISIFVLLAVFILLFGGCINAADDTTNNNTGNYDGKENTGKPPINDDDDDEIQAPPPVITPPVITWEQYNFSISDEAPTVPENTKALEFTYPSEDDEYWGDIAWTLSLVDGKGNTHNTKFAVTDDNKEIVTTAPLALGIYSIRARITGGDYSKEERFTFYVTKSPAEFSQAPVVLPHIINGGNKLEVSWQPCQGASKYEVYINKENNSAGAKKAAETTGRETISAEIEQYPGETNKLTDGTDYYVWVKAFNASGETKFSPVKKQHTSDPIEAWFYTGNPADLNKYYPEYKDTAGMGFDSMYDWYVIKPDPNGEGVHFTYNGGTSGDTFNNDSIILYHRRFDPIEMEEKTRHYYNNGDKYWDMGHSLKGKTGSYLSVPQAISTGLAGSLPVQNLPAAARTRVLAAGYPSDGIIPPSGVFIIKNTSGDKDKYPYYATFYHGMAALAPSGNILIYFGNAAGPVLGCAGHSPLTPSYISSKSATFEHALINYTPDTYNYHIAYVAVAWVAREIEFLGCGPGRHGPSDTNEGWIHYQP